MAKSRGRRNSVKKEIRSSKPIIDNIEKISDDIWLNKNPILQDEIKFSVRDELEQVDSERNPVDLSDFLHHLPPVKQNRRTSFLLNVTSIDKLGLLTFPTFRWKKSAATQQGNCPNSKEVMNVSV